MCSAEMRPAPRNLRLHIGLFGRRNVGKSSLLNALTRQQVSIVSPQPGTTTDPVEKPMELVPLGPVLFVDTAGLDDEGTLGEARSGRSRAALDRVDLAILVAERPVGSLRDRASRGHEGPEHPHRGGPQQVRPALLEDPA